MLATRNHLISYEKDVKSAQASLFVVRDKAKNDETEVTSLKASLAKLEADKKKEILVLETLLHDAREDAKDAKSFDILTGRARVLKVFLDGHLTVEDAQTELDKFPDGVGTAADLVDEETTMEEQKSTADSAPFGGNAEQVATPTKLSKDEEEVA